MLQGDNTVFYIEQFHIFSIPVCSLCIVVLLNFTYQLSQISSLTNPAKGCVLIVKITHGDISFSSPEIDYVTLLAFILLFFNYF